MEDGSSGRHGGRTGLPAHSLGLLPVQPAEGFCGRVQAPGVGTGRLLPSRTLQAGAQGHWGVP